MAHDPFADDQAGGKYRRPMGLHPSQAFDENADAAFSAFVEADPVNKFAAGNMAYWLRAIRRDHAEMREREGLAELLKRNLERLAMAYRQACDRRDRDLASLLSEMLTQGRCARDDGSLGRLRSAVDATSRTLWERGC